jgi:hypothetical protein
MAGCSGNATYLAHRYWSTDLEKVWQGVDYLDTIKRAVEDILNSDRSAQSD